ncbi:MAG: GNAT family N-acetyltransferase [Sciscionella sp.]
MRTEPPERTGSTGVVQNSERMRFELHHGNELAGVLEYQSRGDELSLLHTKVEPRFEGNGFGSRLTREALDTARRDGLAVLPYCWFVRNWIGRHEDYLDLVPEQQRQRFGL